MNENELPKSKGYFSLACFYGVLYNRPIAICCLKFAAGNFLHPPPRRHQKMKAANFGLQVPIEKYPMETG